MPKSVSTLIAEAVEAGKKRDYKTSIKILEDLAAKGAAENFSPFDTEKKGSPEIYLYLSRAWAAEKNFTRAIAYGRSYIKRAEKDPAGWFFLGRNYILASQFEKAAYCLEKSLHLNPSVLEVRAMLGMAYLKGKKARLARAVFEEALKYAPADTKLNNGYLNSLFIEAITEFRSGSLDLAAQMFTFVINNKMDGVLPRLYLAHTLKMQGSLKEALLQYEAACMLAPKDSSLKWYTAMIKMELGNAAEAAEDLAALGIQIPDDGISEQFFALGAVKKHLEAGDYSRAATAARIYIKTFGSNAEIRLLAAEAQRRMGNINTALNHYKCALDDEPQNPYPHYGILLTLQESFRWEELSSAILRAENSGFCDAEDIYYYKIITAAHIDNPPEEVLPHLQALLKNGKADAALFNALACTYVKIGLPELAIDWYDKALLLNDEDEEASIGKIACYEYLDMYDKAYEQYKTCLKRKTGNIYLRRDFVQFLKKYENWEEAANELEILNGRVSGVNFDPDLALFRRKAGQYQKAAILYRKMLLAKPEEKILLHNLVFCLDKMRQPKTALELLKAARNTFGINEDTFLIEGILQMRLKNYEEAARAFQYIAEKYPQNQHAAELLKRVKI